MGAIESKKIEYNGQEISVKDLIDKARKMEKELESKEKELQHYMNETHKTVEEMKILESDLKTITELKLKLEAEISALTQLITDKDITIGEKDLAISKGAAELEATAVLLKQTEDALKEMKAKYSDSEKKLSQCEIDRKIYEESANEYKTRVDDLETCNVNKSAAASAFRSLREGHGPIKKMLWKDGHNWYMYIVENFNDKWKNDDIGKYLWNIAILFNNNSAICIFSTQAGTLTPKSQHNNFYAMNRALIEAVKLSVDYRSHNINKVFFNGVTAKKYTVKFWQGGYLQWAQDGDRKEAASIEGHTNILERDGINQTGELWRWMNLVVNKGDAQDEWESGFEKRNYTMIATPEEGKIVDAPLDGYRFRDMRVDRWGRLGGNGISSVGIDITRLGFNVNDYNAALETPFIIRLEIHDLNKCNRVLEGFAPQSRPSFLPTLITIIVVIFACYLLYKLFSKKCDKDNSETGQEQDKGKGKEMGQNPGQETKLNQDKEMGQRRVQFLSKNSGQDLAQNPGQETEQNLAQPMNKAPAQNSGQNSAQSLDQNPGRTKDGYYTYYTE